MEPSLKFKSPARTPGVPVEAGKVTRRYSFEEMHKILFPDGPPKRRSNRELDEGFARYVQERHLQGRY